jgi:hypothetical protein
MYKNKIITFANYPLPQIVSQTVSFEASIIVPLITIKSSEEILRGVFKKLLLNPKQYLKKNELKIMKFTNPFATENIIKRSFSVIDSNNLVHLITEKHTIFITSEVMDDVENININTYLFNFNKIFDENYPTLSYFLFNYTITEGKIPFNY